MARFLGFILCIFFVAAIWVSVEAQARPPGMSLGQAENQLIGGPVSNDCKPVGSKCHLSSECCSKKCPSYRSKCVA